MASNNYRTASCAVLFILPWQWQTAGPTSVLCQLLDKIQACKFKSYWRPLKIKIHPSQHELLNNSAVIPQTEHARAKKKTLLSYCQKMCIKGTRSFEQHGKNWLGCDIFSGGPLDLHFIPSGCSVTLNKGVFDRVTLLSVIYELIYEVSLFFNKCDSPCSSIVFLFL